ncbi:MAG: hypothetical protein D6786_01375 [Gammaproteobacteria bacterium]|nr:MAG: hypothetical protein D6786_01375 [Gammaproteobacteria bacterium]
MKPGALFRLLLTGYGVTLGGIWLVLSLLALFGQPTIGFGGQPLTGLSGLLAGLVTGVLVVLFTTLVNWLLVLTGNRIWSWLAGLRRGTPPR